MNTSLTEEIIRHIYKSLGVKLPGVKNNFNSIMQPEFMLESKISFEDGEQKNIWGIEFKIQENYLNLLLADCSQDVIPEYALLVSTKDAPSYGCYLSYSEYDPEKQQSLPMIACSLGSSWAECSIFLQATFLSGMEKIKEFNVEYNRVSDEDYYYHNIKNFIKFYQERLDAWEEDR